MCVGGNIVHANQMIEAGTATPEDFKFIMGCEEWEADLTSHTFPGMERFIFVSGALVTDVALLPAMFGDDSSTEEGGDSDPAAAALQQRADAKRKARAGSDNTGDGEGYDHLRFFHQNVVWSEVVRALGPGFVDLAVLGMAVVEEIEEDIFNTPTGPFVDE